MKANLTQREPEIFAAWEEKKIYERMQLKNKNGNTYVLHDGPPYANGHIHMGHALNKILKDIIVKFKSMQGFYSPYVPGWDCHGLPIELQVDKNLGEKKERLGIPEKRRLCREYASEFVEIQGEEFRRLGVFGDWTSPYLTMTNAYEGAIVEEFMKFVKGGYVYRGKKPVHWCPSCITALAEAEVEYADKESPSIYVKFRAVDADVATYLPQIKGKSVFFIIWTTTPWTLPANLALAVNPEYDYVAVSQDGEIFIVAGELKERLPFGGKVLFTVKGGKLEGMRAEHPFILRESKVIAGDFVTVDEGTGIVHIAPGHGEDDYEAGLKYGLDIYAPVDDRGRFTKAVPEFEGQVVFKANDSIIEVLRERNALLGVQRITHSYPHCWRCKKPVIFRATEQWFISMRKSDLRQRCLAEIEKVKWIPSWGRDRIHGMVANRPDWCISRQRSWGVPITLIKCTGCDEFVSDHDILDGIVKQVEAEGSDIWFIRDPGEFLPPGYVCRCGSLSFAKETDILDVWFDSGVSHAAVLQKDKRLSWPAEMYLEGSDQHRGWFQSSLLAAVGTKSAAPYRTVLTHGFVVDGQGKKMSKSLGNVVAPQDIIKKNGAEILRLWVSAEDYRDDIRISKEIIDRLVEAYRKIRNTARFLLGNLYDYDVRDYSEHLFEIDKWAMSRLQGLTAKVTDAYKRFDFHQVYHNIHNFCIVDMSSFYLDILKDRLYTFKADSPERRAGQWTLYQIVSAMTRLMAPVLSFTSEEIWSFMPGRREESVFLSAFPVVDERFVDQGLEGKWERLVAIRDIVNKALEIKRQERFIGNSLDAKISLYLSEGGRLHRLLREYAGFLTTLFIVSQAEIKSEIVPEGSYKGEVVFERGGAEESSGEKEEWELSEHVSVLVEKAQGKKCGRCWNWSEAVGNFGDAPELCDRCYRTLR
ncbi:MAG TPA: isoleucine--tRNA ligase [Thermodesulfovibrionales bacterium]|nr:isoleucine--tRNA ligase [Thermodesulfovibrionales bacterium]